MPPGPVEVGEVLVVSKTHLDVGFTDTAEGVRRRYLEHHLPRALATAAALRARGGEERLVWTTGSWLLGEALADGDPDRRAAVAAGVSRGDLAWHALPFTTHTELADASLLRHALRRSEELAGRFGHRPRAAKLTDVPGHTRALVPLLADAGVELLHVGVNPAWPMPRVPLRFRWEDPAAVGADGRAPGVDVMYQPGGYGDVQVVEGTGTAVAVLVTGDNVGPPSPEDVVAAWDGLRRRFPGAAVRAATLDDVADVMARARHLLPVVTAEIGDPWVHGGASDPVKLAGFRALCRLRAGWLASGRARAEETSVAAASDRLLLVAEHTWGLDQKSHWPETGHWAPAELARVRDRADTVAFEASWAEQRRYLDEAVAALDGGRPDLAVEARAALADLVPPPRPLPAGGDEVDPTGPVPLGGWVLTLRDDGAVVSLERADGGPGPLAGLARPDRPLAALAHRSWDAADVEAWFATACPDVEVADRWWASWDNTKPGLRGSGAVSRRWSPSVGAVRALDGPDGPGVLVELTFGAEAVERAGAPPRAAVEHRLVDGGGAASLRSTLCWWDRPAARWPATTWWDWSPAVEGPSRWRMVKLGEPVDPAGVVERGGVLHAVEELVHPDLRLVPLDAPLVLPVRAGAGPGIPVRAGHGPVQGWRWCLADLRWGTNFPMWCPGDARFRVELHAGPGPSPT